MADTFRNINGDAKAGQKDAWDRPKNPKQSGSAPKNSGDTQSDKSLPNTQGPSKSLNA